MTSQIPISASTRFYFETPDGLHTHKESLSLLREAGFDGVDFALESIPYMGLDDEGIRRYCDDVANHAAKIGMAITFGHLPFRQTVKGVDPKDRAAVDARLAEDMLVCIAAAGYLGMKRAVIHPLGNPKEIPSEENSANWLKKNVEYLENLIPHAEKAGIKFAIENMRDPEWKSGYHRYASTAKEIAEIADATGQENCWDFGHAHTSGLNQKEELLILGDRLTVTHVNDNHAGDDEHLLPYFGTVNWEDVIDGLRTIGFRHFFNLECRMIRVPSVAHYEAGLYGARICRYLTGRISGEEPTA